MSRAFEPLKKEHWAVHLVCSINYKPQAASANNPPNTHQALRIAWKRLAVEFPGLTVRPVGFTKYYVPLDEPILEDWASETFLVNDEECADDIIANSEPRELPSLYYLPHESEVVLLSQHWRTDALGCCMLLDRLFELLASGDAEEPVATEKTIPPLSPSLELAAEASPSEDADIQSYARQYINAFHAKAVNSGGLPFAGDASRPPARTKHHDLTFSASHTRRIVQACKDRSMSVSAAIHVALARTYFSFAESDQEKAAGYTTVMAVNMRPYLKAPYSEPAHACQVYVMSITPTVPYKSDFAHAARALTHEYHSWYTDQIRNSLCWLFRYHAARLFRPRNPVEAGMADSAPPPPPPPKPPSGVTLSSLGIVEQRLKGKYGDSVTVGKFRFGVSVMTRQTLLYAWTFQEELTLSLDYNEAYYSHQMVAEVLSRVKKNLAEDLEVTLG